MGVLAAGVALLFMKLHHGVHHAFHAIRLNVRSRPSTLDGLGMAVPHMWRLRFLLPCAYHGTAGGEAPCVPSLRQQARHACRG